MNAKMIELSPNSPIILLDEPSKVISKRDIVFKFHEILYNGTVFYLGICNHLKDNQFRQQHFNIVFDQSDYWHPLEKKKISEFVKKSQWDRLWEWSLSKILVKEGEKEFFNKSAKSEYNKIFVGSSYNSSLSVFHQENLSDLNELRFLSISHSSNQIFTLVAPTDIGIDCENIRNISPSLKKKIISKELEISIFNFFREFFTISMENLPIIVWSIKESTLKAYNFSNIAEIHNISIIIEDGRIITTHYLREHKCINFFTISNQTIIVISVLEQNSKN